ncbi:MAG TPA: YhcH/YjgK/YiaL family protein [Holophaga sp.]|nr:YhcH/YjgK/YiaL family protein [Holophaga sp.]
MILCPVSQFPRYAGLHPRFQEVAAFLAGLDPCRVGEGRMDLDGDALYASCSPEARTRPAEEAPLEAHRAYIDIQVVLEGTDTMGWAPLAACRTEAGPYDPGKDIVFFREPPTHHVQVPAGHLVVLFPEDAHAPLIGDGRTLSKVVVKVRVLP